MSGFVVVDNDDLLKIYEVLLTDTHHIRYCIMNLITCTTMTFMTFAHNSLLYDSSNSISHTWLRVFP